MTSTKILINMINISYKNIVKSLRIIKLVRKYYTYCYLFNLFSLICIHTSFCLKIKPLIYKNILLILFNL